MNTLIASLAGGLLALGSLIVWQAWSGWADKPKQARGGMRDRVDAGNILGWLIFGVILFVIGYILTEWWAFSLGLACSAFIIRRSVLINRRARISIETGHALASWVEALAAVMRTHSGLSESISSTSEFVSPVIANDVRLLAADAQSQPLSEALASFARRIDHEASDRIAMALIVADTRQTTDLSALLSEMAELTQARAEFVSEIAASRSRIYTEAKAIVGITLFMTTIGLVFGRAWLGPYGNLFGQLMLIIICALYLSAGYILVQLGRAPEQPRFLTFESHGGRT